MGVWIGVWSDSKKGTTRSASSALSTFGIGGLHSPHLLLLIKSHREGRSGPQCHLANALLKELFSNISCVCLCSHAASPSMHLMKQMACFLVPRVQSNWRKEHCSSPARTLTPLQWYSDPVLSSFMLSSCLSLLAQSAAEFWVSLQVNTWYLK